MIRTNVERTIVVRDSEAGDESSFTIYVRDAEDVAEDGDTRHVMMPESVWLSLDDTEQLGQALIDLAETLRAERSVPDLEPDPPKKTPAKKTATRKRPAKKTAGATA